MTNGEKKTEKKIYFALASICLALSLFIVSLTLILTDAKYVAEVGDGSQGNDLPYETQMPFDIKSQQDLYNAVTSGYGYIKLSDSLSGPIIMTGASLDLKRDLTLDLNGKEIERNSSLSLLNVPTGTKLTIIDSKSSGGLYNPIGNVLTVNGGDLNVYGGKFESGPRPTEYYSKLTAEEQNAVIMIDVKMVSRNGTAVDESARMPILPIRGSASAAPGSGNIYFDVPFSDAGTQVFDRDTYCYAVVSGETDDSFAALDVSESSFAYTYYIDASGNPVDEADGGRQVMVLGYEDDIEKSSERTQTVGGVTTTYPAPNYAAVAMHGGKLNIDITDTLSGGIRNAKTGSFYSYFGTWHTYCIYITGGTMDVSTSGEIATVDPSALPRLAVGETPLNSAKYGESACILSDGGTLNIRKIESATSYNGSVISVSGGEVTMTDTKITKNATLSHADSPFGVSEETPEGGGASEFPRRRQYRDAAIFLNGGALNLTDSSVTVNKDIAAGKNAGITDGAYRSSFGILSRGRSDSPISNLLGENVRFSLKGSHSYGIFATRGTLDLTEGNFTLDSDECCYGIYAVNKTSTSGRAVDIRLKGTAVKIGGAVTYENADPSGLVNGKRAASIGVYLDSSAYAGGKVAVDRCNIESQEMGIAVNGGSLTFTGGGEIKAYNASVVYLNDGNIYFRNADYGEQAESAELKNYNIECKINRSGGSGNSCAASDEIARRCGKHRYGIYIPWQAEGVAQENIPEYVNTNAVNVVGGSLQSDGKMNINFRGLYNDYDQYKSSGEYINYDKVIIKSFAIACIDEESKDGGRANVTIKHADITTTVGGGIKAQGGAITLGDENTKRSDITVNALGSVHHADLGFSVSSNGGNANSEILDTTRPLYDKWRFSPNLSGGHAVIARGGSVEIFNGEYEAKFSNGVAVNNDGNVPTTVVIHDGKFSGFMTHDPGMTPAYLAASGPASFYGLKVMGGAVVRIYGGEFDGRNGGAFIRGGSAQNPATVYVYAGTFGEVTPLVKDDGQDGFNVYDFSTVYFGAYETDDSHIKDKTDSEKQNLIKVYGNAFPIALNPLTTKENSINVYIYYGTYFVRRNTDGFGIGAIDDTIKNSNLYIYGFGTNVNNQAGTFTADRIRTDKTTTEKRVVGYGLYSEQKYFGQ